MNIFLEKFSVPHIENIACRQQIIQEWEGADMNLEAMMDDFFLI